MADREEYDDVDAMTVVHTVATVRQPSNADVRVTPDSPNFSRHTSRFSLHVDPAAVLLSRDPLLSSATIGIVVPRVKKGKLTASSKQFELERMCIRWWGWGRGDWKRGIYAM